MTSKKARWETKIGNAVVKAQSIWHIEKSLLKRDGLREPTANHGASGLQFHTSEKANAIAVWKLSSHNMICVTKTMNSEWRLEFKCYSKP
jgi:hypothetical protein